MQNEIPPLTGSNLKAFVETDEFDDIPIGWLKMALTMFGSDGIRVLRSKSAMIRERGRVDSSPFWPGAYECARILFEASDKLATQAQVS